MLIRTLLTLTTVVLTARVSEATFDIDSLFSIPSPGDLNAAVSILKTESPDADLDFKQLAAKYGHPAEEHVVYTEDGYRLKVFHLPGKGCGLPILLFHGVTDSSDTWIVRGNESLAIHLANAGCDVWLGNVRGNKHSQGHISIRLDMNPTFWNFTFHEHALYDLPTTIDLVLSKTGASKLNSIGHSQGTTIHFVLLSTKPEYNAKVNMLIALAPVAYLHHSPPPLGILLRSFPEIYEILKIARQYQLFSDTSPTEAVVRAACSTNTAAYFVCLQGITYQYVGYDLTQVDPSFALVAFKHAPTATSTKNFLHFGQVTIRERFAQFDYGREGNMAAYNAIEPPEYKLENVKTKVVLLTARNDFFSMQADVDLLRRRLPNIVRFVINPRRQMNHLDYIWGANMTTYLFPYIFDSLKKYGKG